MIYEPKIARYQGFRRRKEPRALHFVRYAGHREEYKWRARAKQTRELTLAMIDSATLARLEQRALEYETLADTLERDARSKAGTCSGKSSSNSERTPHTPEMPQ